MDSTEKIKYNIRIHDQIAKQYEELHGEIFNEIEQARLQKMLVEAMALLETKENVYKALDFGCGSGNLTSHLLKLGFDVIASDVSPHFLKLIKYKFPDNKVEALLLNGKDLSNIPSSSLDLICSYSVLHHIPDYLFSIRELARVCKPGGIIYIDHEHNDNYWLVENDYNTFKTAALRPNWNKYLKLSNYYHKIIRLFNSRHTNEGDIHVWPDDHIEWDKIENTLCGLGFEIVISIDYLHYNRLYKKEVYEEFKEKCSDMKVMAFRKKKII